MVAVGVGVVLFPLAKGVMLMLMLMLLLLRMDILGIVAEFNKLPPETFLEGVLFVPVLLAGILGMLKSALFFLGRNSGGIKNGSNLLKFVPFFSDDSGKF